MGLKSGARDYNKAATSAICIRRVVYSEISLRSLRVSVPLRFIRRYQRLRRRDGGCAESFSLMAQA